MKTVAEKCIILLFVLLFGGSFAIADSKQFSISSPDEHLNMVLNLENEEGRSHLTYEVTYKGMEVIEKSKLGIESGNADWSRGLVFDQIVRSSEDTIWIPVYGEKNQIRDHYHAATITFKKEDRPEKRIEVQIRVYNEGVAFRYHFPEGKHGGDYLHITKEHTQFTLPESTKGYFAAWAQSEYQFLPIDEFPGECERPLTLVLPNGLYVSLAEAQMVNFSRMRFVKDKQVSGALRASLYGPVDEITPFSSPWRVIMVAENPGTLIENNDLILNLNPACAIENTDWIKPGKVMREVTLSTEGAKKLVDFAVERNLQYIHFDAGWYGFEYVSTSDATTVTVDPKRNPKGDLDIHEAIAYAKSKGIGVIVYVNQRALTAQLDELLPLYKKWGIDGVKFGFVHVGSHRWTTWLHEAVKKCADYGLLVDIHDEYRPTGFSRTYPNLMTQEGIGGNETFPDATHNTILPFTRYIAGAADYTICYYRQDFGGQSKDENGVPRGRFIRTTAAHQLALSVVYYSPLQYMYWYDKPEDAQNEPELEFFDAVPTVWDNTKVIDGKIGQFITMARKHGEDWFVGSITNVESREVSVPLDFLDPDKEYTAHIYSDGGDEVNTRTKVRIKQKQVDRNLVLNYKLKSSGGIAIYLECHK